MAALCAALTAIYAQTSLLGTYKAAETSKYRTENCRISGMKLSSAFTLGSPEGGLISDNVKGTASFNIGGGYEKITFVVGPNSSGEAPLSDNSLVTVRADGRIVFDEVVFSSDAPRFFTLDIKAAKQLVFSVVRGSVEVTFANVKLWKAGQSVSNPNSLYPKLPSGKVKLVRELPYYNKSSGGYVKPVLGDRFKTSMSEVKTIMVSSKEYDSGLAFSIDQALMGKTMGHASFWLNKRFEKVSFIAGARDNQSSNASVWLVVKGDRKTLYEECIRQNELSRQIVIDVKGVESLTISTEYRSSDFLGGMTLAVVDIYAYRAGDGSVPVPGTVNPNKERIAQLPDVCPLMSSIRPFSVRGVSKANSTLFEGESRHYTFSMGGTKYWEGLLLTTGNTLLGDRIDSYAAFDLAGEYDWISFDAGCLSKRSYMDDDNLLIYVDDQLVFDRKIYSTWPSQHYRIPVYKCRTLKFARRGTGKEKQTVIGVGDIILYRGEPVDNDLFVREVPDAPYETDLIDFCGRPYFHYNGRFVSDLTSFSMDDCFLDGSTITRSFRMKDGREINKGFMLETNIPLGLENVTVMDAVFMLLTGVGASVSSSDVAAYTGVSAGASGTVNMGISLLLNDSSNKQAAAAAFNPMGEYESCTFTVENMREYVDEFAEVFGNMTRENVLNAVKLNVMADRVHAIACTTAEVQPAGAGSHGIRRVGGKNVVGQGRSGDAKRDGRVRGIDEEGREIRGRERREVRRGASEGVKSERIGVVPQQKKSVARFCGHEGGNARRRIKPAVSVPDGVRGRGGIGVEAYEAVAQFTAVAEKRASDVADGPVVGAQGRKRHLYFGQSVSPDVYAHHADYIVGKRHPRHCGEGKGSGAYSHFSVVVHATPLCLKSLPSHKGMVVCRNS